MKILRLVGILVILAGVAVLLTAGVAAARDQAVGVIQGGERLRPSLLTGSTIGVALRDVDDADVTREKLTSPSGAVIDEVLAETPAARAGFRAGDIVVAFDEEPIRSARQLARLITETPEGREVVALVMRNGERLSLKVTPEQDSTPRLLSRIFEGRESHDVEHRHPRFGPDLQESLRLAAGAYPRSLTFAGLLPTPARLGVGVVNLTDQLAAYFGVESGVLVSSVDEGTPAHTAGLRAGDVITKVDGSVVGDDAELRRGLADASRDTEITIVRDRQEQTLTATLRSRDPRDRIIR